MTQHEQFIANATITALRRQVNDMKMETATVSPDEIPVTYSFRPDINREFLTFDIPNGWDDVKKICKKVLIYDGKRFTFSAWNSDTLQCYFVRMLGGSKDVGVARIVKK